MMAMTHPTEELRRISRELSDLADMDLGDGAQAPPLSRVRLLQAEETIRQLYEVLRKAFEDDPLFTSGLCIATCTVSQQLGDAAIKLARQQLGAL